MSRLVGFIIFCFMFFLGIRLMWVWYHFSQKGKNNSSQKQLTMFDVRRLLKEGKKDEAVRIYAQLFKTSPNKALKEVEDLERSLSK